MRGTSSAGGPARRRNGCCSRRDAGWRCAGSRTNAHSTKLSRSAGHRAAPRGLGGGMSRIRRIACNGGSLKKGGSPSTISTSMIPSDHTSTSGPYGNLDITSGDIQYGVPTKDFRLGSSSET
ncbi:unnamed protein product [Spodoptera exigua]|nr:unnamed protein product [Spodoptera exigua]